MVELRTLWQFFESMERLLPTVMVTGGAGFIGSALCRLLVGNRLARVVNIDKLTYAADLSSLDPVSGSPDYHFEKADICDAAAMRRLLADYQPDGVIHLAAESHVDRSIDGPADFIRTNLLGTYQLLDAARDYWQGLPDGRRRSFRFLHVSTDEVFGSLGGEGKFGMSSSYDPSSPYAASKAGADHLTAAWYRTYGLPVIRSNGSNTYGPYQNSEKLIPRMIMRCLNGSPLPVFGDGGNVRDWIHVDDHARALWRIFQAGRCGETYLVGAGNEQRNVDLVRTICRLMDEYLPHACPGGHESLIDFVADRPGHDFRYAVDPSRLETELGWRAEVDFETGLRDAVRWYLDRAVRAG